MKNLRISIIALVVLLASQVFAQNRKAPDFSLKTFDGKTIALSDYKGKVVLVNFWAVWCPPCLHEMPDLEKLNNKYNAKGLQVLGLTVSSKEKKIPGKIKSTGVSYPVLINADKLVAVYGPFGAIPQSFIIDRKGYIVKQITGALSFKEFEAEIKKLL